MGLSTLSVDKYMELAITYGLRFFGAIVIFIVGFWVTKRAGKGVRLLLKKRDADVSLISFLSSFVNVVLKLLVVVIAIASVGVEMTSIAAILGAASLAVGMALSGTLQNFAGGVVILFLKPFKVGDEIEAQGHIGRVDEIAIFTTLIKNSDNKSVIIPNGALSNGTIINYTKQGTRRINLPVSVSYGTDIELVRNVLLAIARNHPSVLPDTDSTVSVSSIAGGIVTLSFCAWVHISDFSSTQSYFIEEVYKQLPKNGIAFPLPQMDVRVKQPN